MKKLFEKICRSTSAAFLIAGLFGLPGVSVDPTWAAAVGSMTTASRTQCVAPCGVFFDAANDPSEPWTSGVVQPVDEEYTAFHYEWNFGDPNSGTWDRGAKKSDGTKFSKNKAFGWNAVHVYENPGTYPVTLKVIDEAGVQHTYEQTIAVSAAPPGGWDNRYFSASGSDASNDCRDINNPCQSVNRAKELSGPNRKLLFRRGDTFSVDSTWAPPMINEPFMIGAYGDASLARPRIKTQGAITFLQGGSSNNPILTDARLVDLWIEGTEAPSGVGISSLADNGLVLRCKVENFVGCIAGDGAEDMIVQETEVRGGASNYWEIVIMNYIANRFAFVGSELINDHHQVMRTYGKKLLFSHNFIQGADKATSSDIGEPIRIQGGFDEVGAKSGDFIILSFNHFQDTTIGFTWDGTADAVNTMRHGDVSGNQFSAVDPYFEGQGFVVIASGNDIAIRNNHAVMDQPYHFAQMEMGYNGSATQIHRIKIYNNTAYSSVAGDTWFRMIRGPILNHSALAGVSKIDIRNNIAVAPYTTSGIYSVFNNKLEGAPHSAFTSDNNVFFAPSITNWSDTVGTLGDMRTIGYEMLSTRNDPKLHNPAAGGLTLQQGSFAVNGGEGAVTAYVRIDADGNYRDAQPDIGAYEYGSGSGAPPPPSVAYTITATAGSGGTITPSGNVLVYQGQSKAFAIQPQPGYQMHSLVVDGTPRTRTPSYTFSNVQSNHTIAVTFSQISDGPPPVDPPPGDNPPEDTPPGDDPPPSTTLPPPTETRFGKFDPVLRMNSSGDQKMSVVFDQKEDGQAELAVYDRNGQLVRSLVNGTLPASRHTVLWDGRNDSGDKLSAGSYVLVLKANGKTFRKKVVLLK